MIFAAQLPHKLRHKRKSRTGRRFSLLAVASEFGETLGKLNGRNLGEAVEGFLQTAAVGRKDIAEAVEEFFDGRRHKAESKDGQRAQLSASL